ncbi:hypothetical protein L1887_47050 [Cichorium endivia]|nr:hypothetical protein L1887_47050 [Cichorium endivia]
MHCSSMRYGMERESICEKKEEEEKKSKTLPIVQGSCTLACKKPRRVQLVSVCALEVVSASSLRRKVFGLGAKMAGALETVECGAVRGVVHGSSDHGCGTLRQRRSSHRASLGRRRRCCHGMRCSDRQSRWSGALWSVGRDATGAVFTSLRLCHSISLVPQGLRRSRGLFLDGRHGLARREGLAGLHRTLRLRSLGTNALQQYLRPQRVGWHLVRNHVRNHLDPLCLLRLGVGEERDALAVRKGNAEGAVHVIVGIRILLFGQRGARGIRRHGLRPSQRLAACRGEDHRASVNVVAKLLDTHRLGQVDLDRGLLGDGVEADQVLTLRLHGTSAPAHAVAAELRQCACLPGVGAVPGGVLDAPDALAQVLGQTVAWNVGQRRQVEELEAQRAAHLVEVLAEILREHRHVGARRNARRTRDAARGVRDAVHGKVEHHASRVALAGDALKDDARAAKGAFAIDVGEHGLGTCRLRCHLGGCLAFLLLALGRLLLGAGEESAEPLERRAAMLASCG